MTYFFVKFSMKLYHGDIKDPLPTPLKKCWMIKKDAYNNARILPNLGLANMCLCHIVSNGERKRPVSPIV